MALLSPGAAGIIRPEQVGPLIIEPLKDASIAFQISTLVPTESPDLRFPIVVQDAQAGWTAEGADITPTDPDTDELVVTPKKCAALVKVSNELANDSSPAAAQVVGDGLVRDLARKV